MYRKLINLIKGIFHLFGLQISKRSFTEDRLKRGEFDWLRKLDINTIYDVGANNGEFVKFISKIFPEAQIYSFEPLKEPFDELKSNTSRVNKIKYLNYALGDYDGESSIYHNQFSPSSSILKMTDAHKNPFPYTKESYEEKIKIKKLDSVFQEFENRENILLKIDVQGFEMNVLKGSESFISSVGMIIIETSFETLYESQPLFKDIYAYLAGKGFEYKGNLGQLCSPVDGKILQADAIFIRNKILPE